MATKNLVISSFSTGIAEIVTLPICTVKTNFQNTNSKSIISTIKHIFNRGGIRGFYSASYPAIFGQMISTSTKYTLYRYFNQYNDNKSMFKSFLNGLCAGICSSLITHPLDTVKIHLQMNKAFVPELKRNGFKIFYRGYSKTLCKIGASSGFFFPIYDKCNSIFENPSIASFFSAIISTTLMHPLDYLKTRHIYGLSLYNGLNPLNYYKGLTLNMARIVPHFTIMMTILEFLSSLYPLHPL